AKETSTLESVHSDRGRLSRTPYLQRRRQFPESKLTAGFGVLHRECWILSSWTGSMVTVRRQTAITAACRRFRIHPIVLSDLRKATSVESSRTPFHINGELGHELSRRRRCEPDPVLLGCGQTLTM